METTSCNLCGETSYVTWYRNKDRNHKITDDMFNVVRCTQCGLVYLNPRPTHEEIGIYYPDTYGPYVHKGSILKDDIFFKAPKKKKEIPSQDTSMKTYLDFGCGGGNHLEAIQKKHPNWKLHGLDMSEKACEEARSKGFEVTCVTAEDAVLPENHFDHIYMSHVVEHLHDPKQVLEKLYHALKPGGTLIVSTPNVRSVSAHVFRSFWFASDSPRHLFLFSPQTLSHMLRDVGFAAMTVTFDNGPKCGIRSIYHLFGKRDMRIPRTLWKLCRPLSGLLARLGLSSIMTITAAK